MSNPGNRLIDALLAETLRGKPECSWSKSISDWARETFGASTPERALERAQEEWDELKLKPSAEEAADVVICLTAYVRTLGSDMAAEVERKMEINRAREWRVDGSGCGYHVKAKP